MKCLNILAELDQSCSASEKLSNIHRQLHGKHPFVDRVAIAVYDDGLDLIKTYIHSDRSGANPLPHYQAFLAQVPTLKRIKEEGMPRLINDMHVFESSGSVHASRLLVGGYKSSFTVPLFSGEKFLGFTFYNSRRREVFGGEVIADLQGVAEVLAMLLHTELKNVDLVRNAVRTAIMFVNHRSYETGGHLERVARYSRLIAREIAGKYALDEEYVERIYWYAPFHDVGKIVIPDEVLMKQGTLTPDEFDLMKQHTTKGGEIFDEMADIFQLSSSDNLHMLRNIALYHHENVDGTGYPTGLAGDAIPVEARIVAIADVFDALTSHRCYKRRWDNEMAIHELNRLAGNKLDMEMVKCFIDNLKEVEAIQKAFDS